MSCSSHEVTAWPAASIDHFGDYQRCMCGLLGRAGLGGSSPTFSDRMGPPWLKRDTWDVLADKTAKLDSFWNALLSPNCQLLFKLFTLSFRPPSSICHVSLCKLSLTFCSPSVHSLMKCIIYTASELLFASGCKIIQCVIKLPLLCCAAHNPWGDSSECRVRDVHTLHN